jgi:hypothetical protein
MMVLLRSVESRVLIRCLDQNLSGPEDEPEQEERAEVHKATLLDLLKGLEAARKHM